MSMLESTCPLCATAVTGPYLTVSARGRSSAVRAVDYFECGSCDFFFADSDVLTWIDGGGVLRVYDAQYWDMELVAARERSFGSSLARVAEVMLYARKPVRGFIDIGTGPGYLLDALAMQLPHSIDRFYGVEKFPPPTQVRTARRNYIVGGVADTGRTFQAGSCIEVLEHLTPAMLRSLVSDLANVSEPGAVYIFNTGLTDFIRENQGYLDPFERGHITGWSVTAARKVFDPFGFRIFGIKGKTWAFAAEYRSEAGPHDDICDRIWTAVPENKQILHDPTAGSVLYVLGLETARAYS